VLHTRALTHIDNTTRSVAANARWLNNKFRGANSQHLDREPLEKHGIEYVERYIWG